MSLRTLKSLVMFMPFNAVIFGLMASVILLSPALSAHAAWLLPAVLALSLTAAPLVWFVIPQIHAAYTRAVGGRAPAA